MSGRGGRMYGLILKKRPSASLAFAKPSIFQDDDSSSDEGEKGRKTVNETIGKEAEKKKQMRQTQIERDKVLDEDPTAYDYDKVYDEMADKKASLVAAKRTAADKKPKYIGNLLKFAEVRKKEDERRIERQVQKEREAEGSEFVDKDAFVTSAYRKKMQEMAEDEERQRKLDELEGDVTKQTDLSKFFRNLLDKNVSTGGAYDSEARTKVDEKISETDQESSSSAKDADARERRHEKSDSRGGKTLEKSDRQLNKDERRDVTKQTDLSKFFRNLLDKNVSTGGAYDSEARTKVDEKISETDQESSSSAKDADARERRHEKSDSRGGKTLEKSNRQLNKDERRKKGSSFEAHPSHAKKEDGHGRNTKSEKLGRDEEQREKTRDSEERREKTRDSEERRGKTRDSKGRREKTRDSKARREKSMDNEGRREKTRDNEEQRETTRDDRPKVAKDDKGRRGSTKDNEEQEIVKEDSRDDEEETNETERRTMKTPEINKQTLDSTAMNDESQEKVREKNVVSKFAKHSSSETVLSARERYLARKNVRVVMTQPTSEDEDQ